MGIAFFLRAQMETTDFLWFFSRNKIRGHGYSWHWHGPAELPVCPWTAEPRSAVVVWCFTLLAGE